MLSSDQIVDLLTRLDSELAREGVNGELFLVGGAVMMLALAARPSTYDVDGLFAPADVVRRLARLVAIDAGVDESWLNDAVKGFLSPRGEFAPWRDFGHLRVFVAAPEYLLAMKCMAFRLGPEFKDEADVRFLLRHLGITRVADALAVVERYFPPARIPLRTRYGLEEMLGE